MVNQKIQNSNVALQENQSGDFKRLKYIQDHYMESFNFLQARKKRQVRQLVLLNNLQRGDQNIASTLLLTLFNRVMSSLYDDKIQIKFLPSQGITQEQLNAYNILAQSDYIEMNKAKIDYDWIWDTLFFGQGYCETYKFNKQRKIMEPCVINPLVFGYDPYFEEVQDWRYYWKWITKSEYEMQRLIDNGTITSIKSPNEIPAGVDEYLWNYKILRDRAQKAIEPPPNSLGSSVYQILEYYGYNEKGEKCCFWLDRSFSKVLYEEVLDFEDLDYGDGKKGSKWPIVVKQAFREPHSSVPFSLADLLEDKHRAKSVLLNLAFIAAKDQANPIYWYNSNVSDVTQLMSRQVDQHIKLEGTSTGEQSVGPLSTQDPMSPGLLQFISILTTEANEPIGTGTAQQPQQKKGNNTATEAAIDQQLNDMAQSLQSKVIQFGESEFWSHWFHRYAKYGPELGDKMANIVGVKGITSEIVDFKNFNTDYPPGVLVYSAKEAEYKELVLRRDLMQLYPQLAQTLDPDGLRNFNKFVFFPKFLSDPSLIDIMFPKTLDEIKAEEENQRLIDDEVVEIQPTDDHTTHIYTHMMIPPGQRTWSLWVHKAQHEQALAQQKQQQQAMGGTQAGQNKVSETINFQNLPPEGQVQMAAQAGIKLDPSQISQEPQPFGKPPQQNQPPKVGGGKVALGKRSPLAAAVPLQGAMNPSDNLITNNQQ